MRSRYQKPLELITAERDVLGYLDGRYPNANHTRSGNSGILCLAFLGWALKVYIYVVPQKDGHCVYRMRLGENKNCYSLNRPQRAFPVGPFDSMPALCDELDRRIRHDVFGGP